jgi:aspartyl aminopeptidase
MSNKRAKIDPSASYVEDFLEFLNDSPTHFHATAAAIERLLANKFILLLGTNKYRNFLRIGC